MLNCVKTLDDGTPYYRKINKTELETIKKDIKQALTAAMNRKEIDKDLHESMDPSTKDTSMFFICVFKTDLIYSLSNLDPLDQI